MERCYVVTGATRGIGLELTRQIVSQGHRCIATIRDRKRAESLLALEKTSGGLLRLENLDVTDDASVVAFAKNIEGTTVDVLLNNAGILDREDRGDMVHVRSIQQQFETNTLGAIRVTQALLPHLRRSSAPVVANMSSLMGSITDNGSGGYNGYRISKAALNMWTKCLSIDEPGLLVVSLHPGWVQTEMGGERAPVEVSSSARGILQTLATLKRQDTGHFFDYQGRELPW